MQNLTLARLKEYRAFTYNTLNGKQLHSVEDAVAFVNWRGFVFFWPVKNVELPSLWAAAAGDRPVPDEHDDPGHVTWDWKDSSLGKKCWYYARILRRRNTFISFDILPYFYALSPNYGEPEIDYLEQYEEGVITAESRAIFESLLNQGPLDTLALRRAAHMTGAHNNTRFSRALDDLQVQFRVLPVGISSAGSWHYAFIYDLTHRHLPELIDQARPISESQARQKLVEVYLKSVGAIQPHQLSLLFGWNNELVKSTLQALGNAERIKIDICIEGQSGEWIAIPDIFDGV